MSLVWESQSQTGRITPEKFPEMVRSDWRASEWTGLLVCPPNGSVRVLSKPKRMKKRWKYFGDGRVQTCILWKTAAKGICHDTACSAVLDPCLGINTLNRQILKMNRNFFFLFRLVWCTLALVSAAARNVSCLDGIVKRTDTLQEVIKVCELGNHQFEKVNQWSKWAIFHRYVSLLESQEALSKSTKI